MSKRINVEERLLGMMAVEKRFITEKQLTECLNTIEFFEPDKTLEEVFLTKEYLTKPQIDRLRDQLQVQTEVTEAPTSNTKLFGEMALEQNMIDEDQLFGVLDDQEQYHERGIRVQIGQIMCKKGFLTIAQVARLLESQLKKVLYCKNCKITSVIHSYNPGQIYQCEECQLDLIEATAKKVVKPMDIDDEDDEESEEDGDFGQLDILEL